MIPGHSKRPMLTLFHNKDDMDIAMLAAIDLLTSNSLPITDTGFCSIDDLCERIKATCPQLSYINRNHIVELYFKDKNRKIFISGLNDIKYKEIRYVQPPDVLYFGTLTKLIDRMRNNGIKSSTKGYLKLYGNPQMARDFARKFIRNPNDRIAVITVDAVAAYKDGMKFSTYKPDEYIIARISQKYITGVS